MRSRFEKTCAMQIFWFIPTHGDSRYLGTAKGARQLSHDYLQQVAVAADSLGYEGVLIPTGRSCEDPWVVASSLIAVTKKLKFLVAVRPGLHQPAMAARMAATFDRLSGGRLLINLVTGGDQTELEGDGVFLDHATRYEQSAEFIRIWREILARSQRGLVQAGAHGHQELEFLGHGDQAGCNHPGVFARAPGRDQNALVAQAVGGHRHLLEVVMAELARAFGSAKVAAVAVGGNEPENLHGTGLFKAVSQRGPYGVSRRWQSRTGARAGPRVAAAGSAPRRRP